MRSDSEMYEWLRDNGYVNYGDYDRLENKLDELGFLQGGSSRIVDLEDKLYQCEAVINILLRRLAVHDQILKLAIQKRISGFYQSGKDMVLHIASPGDPDDDIEPPSIFDCIKEIVEGDPDTRFMDDLPKPH